MGRPHEAGDDGLGYVVSDSIYQIFAFDRSTSAEVERGAQPLLDKKRTRLSSEALLPTSCPFTISSPMNEASCVVILSLVSSAPGASSSVVSEAQRRFPSTTIVSLETTRRL